MRIIVCFFVWCGVLLSSGCAIWEYETTNRGGYLDHLADVHWLKADSKRMRALRAFAIQVSLAHIASVSAKNESDRKLLAQRLGETTKRFLPVLACALDRNPLNMRIAEDGSDPCFYYDSAMVDYSTALFDLAMVALPLEDAKRLVNAAAGTAINPLNVVEVLETLVAIGRYAWKYGRVVGAIYRDTVELDVQVWLATPRIDPRPPPHRVTDAHVAALKAAYESRTDNMTAWTNELAALRAQGLEPWPDPRFFTQLRGLMRFLCHRITSDRDARDVCKKDLPESALESVPALNLLTMSPIRGIPGTTGSGQSGSGSASQSGAIKVDAAVTDAQIAAALTAFVNSTDRRAPNSPFKAIGLYIGVPDEEAKREIVPGRSYNVPDVVSKPGYEGLRKALLKRACREGKIGGPSCDLVR